MRKILPFLIFIILLGCVKDQISNDESDFINRRAGFNNSSNGNVYGNWIVAFYENLENGSIIKKSDVDSWGGLDVAIKFKDDSTFCGVNTSNEIAGHYTMQNSMINIDVYGGSKVGQPEWGNMFSELVYSHSITSFKKSNSQLKLFYNNNKNCVVLYPHRREIQCVWHYSGN
ncbi:MAG: hypothetical protein Q8868_06230 [Bacteroidota bacterium]|nr:hypothetical protein [Bacteroidota bacterium]